MKVAIVVAKRELQFTELSVTNKKKNILKFLKNYEVNIWQFFRR